MIPTLERITPTLIKSLGPSQVFVFGSNLAGKHGLGAAKDALQWGAIYGVGIGIAGKTYAIPTKDEKIKTLSLEDIEKYVKNFIEYSKGHKDTQFLVTAIGCGYAGYGAENIAPMFKTAINLKNICLPAVFWARLV